MVMKKMMKKMMALYCSHLFVDIYFFEVTKLNFELKVCACVGEVLSPTAWTRVEVVSEAILASL